MRPQSRIQNFGFINGVDNVNWTPYRDSLYGGQFTLSTLLIKQNFCILPLHRRSTIVSLETTPRNQGQDDLVESVVNRT